MKSIWFVITDAGDGSNYVEWHKTMSPEKEDFLALLAALGGDGFQCKELQFPDDFDLDVFAKVNHIHWFEDDQNGSDESDWESDE